MMESAQISLNTASASIEPTVPVSDGLSPYHEDLKMHFASRDELFAEIKAQTSRKQKLKKAVTKASIATALALFTFALWVVDPVLESTQVATAVGETSRYQMADGSVITLNTNTRIMIESHLHTRRVMLTQGEALFTVTHGWRPFTVYAYQATIRDIGTQFTVLNTAEGVIVTVLQGAVEVATRDFKQILTTHQQVTTRHYRMGALQVVNQEASHAMTAWLQGKLMFDGTPLSQAVAQMQRYRHAPIVLLDTNAANLRLSGAYNINDMEALIDALSITLNVNVTRHADGAVTIASR